MKLESDLFIRNIDSNSTSMTIFSTLFLNLNVKE